MFTSYERTWCQMACQECSDIADNPSFIVNEAGICQALDVDNKALGVEDSEIEEVDVNGD